MRSLQPSELGFLVESLRILRPGPFTHSSTPRGGTTFTCTKSTKCLDTNSPKIGAVPNILNDIFLTTRCYENGIYYLGGSIISPLLKTCDLRGRSESEDRGRWDRSYQSNAARTWRSVCHAKSHEMGDRLCPFAAIPSINTVCNKD